MLCGLFCLALLSASAHAAPLLDPHAKYVVKKEILDLGAALPGLDSSYFEMKMDFESFDGNSKKGGKPMMATHTDQLLRMKKLPQRGEEELFEMLFERLLIKSEVQVPGMAKPFEMQSDLGIYLMNKPIVIVSNRHTGKRVEGLEELRTKLSQEVKDPMIKQTLMAVLTEDLLVKNGASFAQKAACLSEFAQKKPGAKWKFSLEEQGAKLDFECVFQGWAEAKGKKIAVIGLKSPSQKQQRKQPNGTPAMATTEGSGTMYVEPQSQESLVHMDTSIFVEPTPAEANGLKKKHQAVPRNRSYLSHWSHNYPL